MYTLTETAKMNGINPEGYPITRLIASESCCPGTGGRAADKRLQARCASHPPFRFAKRHPRATRNACPLTCQLMSKLLMGGVNVEGVVRRTLTGNGAFRSGTCLSLFFPLKLRQWRSMLIQPEDREGPRARCAPP